MNRSEVNQILCDSAAFMARHGVELPPFARWSPDHLRARVSTDSALVRANSLGWDITDFGLGRFEAQGLVLFTLRNGTASNIACGRGALYAEKVMISRDRQVTPAHRHNLKTEDIINRGGGALVLELFRAGADGGVDEQTPVSVLTDGTWRILPPGGHLRLLPGESVTLEPDCWHAFWGEGGDVLIGEVSNVNDDRTDNVFRDPIGRFASVTEDAPPLHLLVSDYDTWLPR
jgi:D-lyxose ketol-isomerase